MIYFDAHAHLDDRKFNRDRIEMIERARDAGVKYTLNASSCLNSSQASVEIAKEYKGIFAAIGIHPHNAKDFDDQTLLTLELMSMDPNVKAIGEIGLDFYRDLSPRDVQEEVFRQQIRLAKRLGLPIVIHDRDSNQQVFDILRQESAFENGLQMHSYSASSEMARQYVKLGAYISISGPVTFKNARIKREVVETVPLDRLLIETDAPYLTAEPKRGQRNEPAYVVYTCRKIAEIKNISEEEVAAATTANAKKLFRID